VVLGEAFVWHEGDLQVTNTNTQDKATIHLKSIGFNSKKDYTIAGQVMNSDS
jgi:hypothetical protein